MDIKQTTITLYILQLSDTTHYCGITKNLLKRLQEHNTGQSKSTRNKRPLILKYIKEFKDYSTARKKEVSIKRQGVTRWYKKNIHYKTIPTANSHNR